MLLNFTKMQGAGNDFIVLDARRQLLNLDRDILRRLADRHFGVGCDQILLLEPPAGDADVRYRIFNADGGEVEQCGNGARAVARFLAENGLHGQPVIRAETMIGTVTLYLESGNQVRVNMGEPRFEPDAIPLAVDQLQEQYTLKLDNEAVTCSAVSMGNPHAVIIVDDVDTAPVARLGRALQASHWFPAGVNIGFMQIIDRGRIRLRVYERGAGETLACGSGACAAAVIGITRNLLDGDVEVDLPGGRLRIHWVGTGEPVWMTGPAEFVFTGSIEI